MVPLGNARNNNWDMIALAQALIFDDSVVLCMPGVFSGNILFFFYGLYFGNCSRVFTD